MIYAANWCYCGTFFALGDDSSKFIYIQANIYIFIIDIQYTNIFKLFMIKNMYKHYWVTKLCILTISIIGSKHQAMLLWPVYMFENFHLMFTFKSKVSCDVFKNKKMNVNWHMHLILKCHLILDYTIFKKHNALNNQNIILICNKIR